MAKFMLVYLGGDQPSTPPEEGKKHFAEYSAWLASLGDAVISAANPIKDTHIIETNGTSKSGSTTMMSGYSVLEAESIDEAISMSKSCPFLNINGTLEVSEMIEMNM